MSLSFQKNKFAWSLLVLNVILAAYATPIYDWGDPSEYIILSESFLGLPTDVNLSHRSPLYSIILAGVMLLLKPPLLYKVMVFFNYMLLGFTSWMVYRLFQRVFSGRRPAIIAALLFNLSFSTLFYADFLQTEILSVFLVILSLVILIQIDEGKKIMSYVALGTTVGLLSLARFSAVPLVFTFFVLLLIVLLRQKASARKWVTSLGAFLLPYFLLINGWCFYNQYQHGFYGLFPHSGQGVSRNIIVSSIRPTSIVSPQNQPVLEIFVQARASYLDTPKTQFKGSLARFDKYGILPDLYGGYAIYMEAVPQLRQYFGLSASSGEYELSQKLADFYQEISEQNKAYVMRFRFISFLSGFRASVSGTLPPQFGEVNLNILPSFVFKIYRIAIVFVSLFVFLAFFFFAIGGMKNGWHFDFTLLAMFFIVFSFWGINFVFVTAADANRFKFPAEPLIFGLFVYYVVQTSNWLLERFRSQHHREHQTANT